ncbi:MAG TPA: DUF3574 domain-containing protein [Methylomirabilota bacterium]|nr:DUF3574 domain-containing protein [Methylomirabilota bacterium]
MISRPRRGAGAAGLRGLVAVLLLLEAAGCAGHLAPPPPPGSQTVVRSELIFGRLKPDGSAVTDAEWRAFVAEHVTPRFPDGFTVLDAVGQYRDRQGQVQAEATKILLIVHGLDARPRAAIQELRDVYRRLFQQESVLLIESPAHAAF